MKTKMDDEEDDCFIRRSEDVARGLGCTHTHAIVTGKFCCNNYGFDDGDDDDGHDDDGHDDYGGDDKYHS